MQQRQRIPNIDLKLIKTFLQVYEFRSMSRAAENLCCSPAAVSMRLKSLEEEIGDSLFIRQHNRLYPTDIGEILYWKAISIQNAHDEFIETTRLHVGRRTIKIGVPDDYALSFIQRSLRHVDELLGEDIEIDIICSLSSDIDCLIQRKEIDIGLATLDYLSPNGALLAELKLNWVAASNFIRDEERAVPLAVYPEGCVFRRAMIEALESHGTAWRIASQSKTNSGVLAAVRAGFAITTMADGSIPSDLTMIDYPFLPPLRRIPIYLLKRPGMSDAVNLIEKAIVEQLRVTR